MLVDRQFTGNADRVVAGRIGSSIGLLHAPRVHAVVIQRRIRARVLAGDCRAAQRQGFAGHNRLARLLIIRGNRQRLVLTVILPRSLRIDFNQLRGNPKSYMAIGFAFFARNPHRLVTLFPCFYPNFLITHIGCFRVILCPVSISKLIPYFQTIFVLAKNFRSDSMRSAIIRSNILLCVKNDIIHLFGIVNRNDVLTISCNGYFLLRFIPDNRIFIAQTWMLVRRIHCVNRPEISFVFRNFRRLSRTIIKIMVNSISRLRKFEVELQDEGTVTGDGAGKHVIIVICIEHVLVVFRPVLICTYIDASIRRSVARFGLFVIAAASILIVELDGILRIRVGRPDGIEDVFADVIDLHLISGLDGAGAFGVGIPAHEGIALAGESVFRFGSNGGVIGEAGFRHVIAFAAVGLVGQGDGGGTSAPDAGEGYVVLDLILIAGLVGVLAIGPAEEVLAIRDKFVRRHEVSIAILRVLLGVRRGGNAVLAGYISYGEGAILGIIRIEEDIVIDFGIDVEGVTGAVRAGAPTTPSIAGLVGHDLFLELIQLCGNRIAIGNIADGFSSATLNGHAYIAGKGRLNPLSVDRDVLRGHDFACEFIFLFARGVSKPAGKNIVFHADRLGFRRIVSRISDALLKQVTSRFYPNAIADVNDIVTVAGIIEASAIIPASILGAFFCIAREARDRVAVLISHARPTRRTAVRMI